MMRHRYGKSRIGLRKMVFRMLSILSHVAAIIGTIVAAMDTLHHW
jgi:hypothetical protein